MSVTVDKVIVELEAKLDRYNANLRAAESRFGAATKSIERNGRRMEDSIRRNSQAIGNQMRVMAGTLAAAFSVQKVIELTDSYTRFTNQLKLAGLEGGALAQRQEQLFVIAQRYGVNLESLGVLYGKGAAAAKDLGASQAQLMQFTEGVSAALKVQGGSAASSAGALQQLSQLLGGAKVQAEEFNSIIDGARPILTAVAKNLDGAAGSVSRLKAMVNTDKGVSSAAFFQAFLKGTEELKKQAQEAALTIGNSFTILNNALGKYLGEADASLSATQRISQAIILLSNNLDTVAKALGLIAAVLLGRFAASMIGAAASTGIVSASLFALQARALGAATSMEALGFASATAGRSMLALFGGPIGLAVAALAVGFYYLNGRVNELSEASAEYAAVEAKATGVRNKAADAASTLATATGKARVAALANAAAVRQETVQMLAQARAALILARAKARAADAAAAIAPENNILMAGPFRALGIAMGTSAGAGRMKAQADAAAAKRSYDVSQSGLAELDRAMKAPPAVSAAAPGKKPKKPPKGRKGPDPDELERRFLDDMDRGYLEYQAAVADITGTLHARDDVERKRIRAEEEMSARAIRADKDLTAAQRGKLLELNKQIADARMEAQLAKQREQDAADVLARRTAGLANERDLLEAQAGLLDTAAKRLAAELRILDLQYEEEKLRLEGIRDNARLNEIDRELARERLKMLPKLKEAAQANIRRQNEGAGQRYLRGLNVADIGAQLEEVGVKGLQALEDKLVDVTAKVFKLGGAFGEVANSIIADLLRIAIQQMIIKPLAEWAFGTTSADGSSSGGALSALFKIGSAYFGRASGGKVVPGTTYIAGEHGPEPIRVGKAGLVTPNGRLSAGAMGGGGGAPQVIRLYVMKGELFDVQVDNRAINVSMEVVRQAAPHLTNAAVAEAGRRLGREGF